MLFLIALPVLALVAASHQWLHEYTPTNQVISRARLAPPKLCTVQFLGAAAIILILAMRAVKVLITAGAPGWLNLLVLVLAWDAIKFGLASGGVAIGCVRKHRSHRRRVEEELGSRPPADNDMQCAHSG